MTNERVRLHWKFADGPEDADDEEPNGVGPAWINYPDGRSEKVNGGNWMTRSRAKTLAADSGFVLDEDGWLFSCASEFGNVTRRAAHA